MSTATSTSCTSRERLGGSILYLRQSVSICGIISFALGVRRRFIFFSGLIRVHLWFLSVVRGHRKFRLFSWWRLFCVCVVAR